MLLMLALLGFQDPGGQLASTYFRDLPVSVATYEVTGASTREVWKALEERQPTLADGSRSNAMTSWRLPTQWGPDERGRCAPATASVRAEFEVVMPTLSPSAVMTERARARWNAHMDSLARHEAERMRRVVNGARALEQRLRSQPDCSRLQQTLDEGVREIGRAARALDLESPRHSRLKPNESS